MSNTPITPETFNNFVQISSTLDPSKGVAALKASIKKPFETASSSNPLIILIAASQQDTIQLNFRARLIQYLAQQAKHNISMSRYSKDTFDDIAYVQFKIADKQNLFTFKYDTLPEFSNNKEIVDTMWENIKKKDIATHIQLCSHAQIAGKNSLPYENSLYAHFNAHGAHNIMAIYPHYDAFNVSEIPANAIEAIRENSIYLQGLLKARPQQKRLEQPKKPFMSPPNPNTNKLGKHYVRNLLR